MRSSKKPWLLVAGGFLIPLALYASSKENGMYHFVDGQKIITQEVNDNFQHLAGLINTTDNSAAILVDEATGIVRIRTTKPNFSLQIGDESNVAESTPDTLSLGGTFSNIAGANAKLRVWNYDNNYMGLGASLNQLDYLVSSPYFDHAFYVASKEVLRIKNNGNVGIGTDSPQFKLQVGGDTSTGTSAPDTISLGGTYSISAGANPKLRIWNRNGDHAGFGVSGLQLDYIASPTNFDHVFYVASKELMRIKSSGNIGVGTTKPLNLLHLSGGDGAARIRFEDLDNHTWIMGSDGKDSFVLSDDSAGGATRFRIDGTGNVGIGTSSPAYKLEVNGTFHATTVSVMGDVIANDYLTNSDARLKTDILPLENASEGISCLQGVTYRWSDPDSPQELQLGLIAQEVERCFPEVVTTDSSGYKSVSYARLVAPLIESAKEQQALNVAQQREITRLKAEQAASNAQLRAELSATNARLERLEALLSARR